MPVLNPNSSSPSRTKASKIQLKYRIRLADGSRRYVDPVYSANGKLRPSYAIVDGKAELHPEGVYAFRRVLSGKRVWETVGRDAQLAMTTKLRLEHSAQAAVLGLEVTGQDPSASGGGIDLDEAIVSYLEDCSPEVKKGVCRLLPHSARVPQCLPKPEAPWGSDSARHPQVHRRA